MHNIIPATVEILGTLRTIEASAQRQAIREIRAIVRNIAAAFWRPRRRVFFNRHPGVE